MRKVGTNSSAIGLIFFGIWMIISKFNYNLAKEIFKWWPLIFVILGIELILVERKKIEKTKTRFDFMFVFVMSMFLCADLFQYFLCGEAASMLRKIININKLE